MLPIVLQIDILVKLSRQPDSTTQSKLGTIEYS